MNRVSSLILLLIIAIPTFAQSAYISGKVTDSDGKNLSGIMVKLISEGRTRSMARSSAAGEYRIKLPAAGADSIAFEHISFNRLAIPIENERRSYNVTLHPRTKTLKEVVFVAPSVRQRGDTLTFDLGSFIGKGDFMLEDALKKIPGISVDNNGAIKYMGKDISKFYIEGLDMLGGKYTTATRNIPADYVTSVEVIENHKDKKIDKDTYSDNIALNVKLKNKVKFKPTGTSEALAGYGDNDFLYRLGVTGMIFNPDFQTIVTTKYGNDSELSLNEITYLYGAGESPESSVAWSNLGSADGATPPVSRNRYISPHDFLINANGIKKQGSDVQISAKANYAYSETTYDYSSVSRYFAGTDEITVDEYSSPSRQNHKPSLDLTYRLDKDNRYIYNRLNLSAAFHQSDFFTSTPQGNISQNRDQDAVSISNALFWQIKKGSRMWALSSNISYILSPKNILTITPDEALDIQSATQENQSTQLNVSQNISTSFIKGHSRITLPIELSYKYTDLATDLNRSDNFITNRLYSNFGTFSVSPSYTYDHPANLYNLTISLPLRLTMLSADNKSTDGNISKTQLNFNPSIYTRYQLTTKSVIKISTSLTHGIGDALTLLTNPIQTSYRNIGTRSGILAKNSSINASLNYEFRLPLEFWFTTAGVNYTRSKTNLMNSQYIDPNENISGLIAHDNTSQTIAVNGNISKSIQSIHTKFQLSGNYVWHKRETMQQKSVIPYYTRTYHISPLLSTSPSSFIEINYNASYSKSINSYLGTKSSYEQLSNAGHISIFPLDGLEIRTGADYIHKEISPDRYKDMTLLNISATYKIKGRYRFKLSADNLLDRRSYSYTIFNGLDTYSYDFRLRGRLITLSFTITR